MSRLAKSSPQKWEDIFRQNRDNLLDTINEYEKNLSLFKSSLKNKDWTKINKLMNNANTLHQIFK